MYADVKNVRYWNDQKFIDAFKRSHVILVMAPSTSSSFRITKRELWNTARFRKIKYVTDYCPYVVKRKCLTVL